MEEYVATFQMLMLPAIVSVALVVFIGSWEGVDAVGRLELSAPALKGLVTPQDALARFNSTAVVTV